MQEMIFAKNKKIILFDGFCNLCNGAVNFIIKNDRKNIFLFCSIQSKNGKAILDHIGIDPTKTDSIVLYVPNVAYYVKSDAALEITNHLGLSYQMIGLLKILPLGFRNSFYDYVAKNRYRWFGKNESCMVPNNELLSRFL